MKRKNFIANTSLVSLSLSALALESCNHPEPKEKGGEENHEDDFELNEVTIDELQQKMKENKWIKNNSAYSLNIIGKLK